jgi:hypothetical protein
MNRHWRILRLLDALHFNKDLSSTFGSELWTVLGPQVMVTRISVILQVDFPEIACPHLLVDVALNVCEGTWFQHDGVPPYSSCQERNWFNSYFPDTLIDSVGLILWSPSSLIWTHPISFYGDTSKKTFTVRKYRFHLGMTLTSFTVLWRIDPLLRGDFLNNSRCYATGE